MDLFALMVRITIFSVQSLLRLHSILPLTFVCEKHRHRVVCPRSCLSSRRRPLFSFLAQAHNMKSFATAVVYLVSSATTMQRAFSFVTREALRQRGTAAAFLQQGAGTRAISSSSLRFAEEGQAEVILVGCGAPNRGMGWYHGRSLD